MPEQTEIEWLVDNLKKTILGVTITSVEILRNNIIKSQEPLDTHFPLKITEISRRGKYVILGTDKPTAWLCHMAFTGWIIPDWAENSSPRKFLHPVDLKHTRMLFNTDRGKIHWVDPRLLSKLFIFKDVESVKNSHYLSDMGPDCESLRAYLKLGESREKESRKIRDLLLDQRFIAGIGNYLCSEILHAAKVQPRKRLKEFSPDEVIELYRTIKEVLERARTEETKDWWKVFGRKICGDCGGPVTREAWGNRGHYICPNCVNTQLK